MKQPNPPAPFPKREGGERQSPSPLRGGVGEGLLYDAVVIGAGPAGAVAARELARGGTSVLLVDKATFPRPKVCGCCLNGAALAALESVGLGHVSRQCGAVPLTAVRIAAGRRSAEPKLPAGVALSREQFDVALIDEAVKAGATFRTGVTWRAGGVSPLLNGNEWKEETGGLDPPLARITIRATGLAGNPGRPARGSRLGAGVVVERAPDFFAPGTIYMATGRGGYVGLVRLEDGRLDIAAAFDAAFVRGSGKLGQAAKAILAGTGWPAIPDLEALPWKGTPPLTRRPAAVAGDRWFAVGDAAGYVEPFTGEGMAWAVASAAAVAPVALKAIVGWNDDLAREWRRTHARLIGGRQGICRVVARVLRSPALTRIAVRTLSVLPLLSRPVVAALNRPSRLPHGFPA